jgi:AraC family transcriptional regulator, positive regulator of tynA and feaB
MGYIDAHLSDPDLDPTSISEALGISVRYLHRCFEATNTSVMEYLRLQRLRRCYADLADPRCNRSSISDLALRNGFRNVTHFNDIFKAQYGVPPRVRRAASSSR